MTVIACRILKDGYEIAADSISVRGYTQTKGQTTSLSKLFEVNNIVIGCTGTAEEGSLFRLFITTRKPSAVNEAAILEFLSEFSDWKKKKIDNGELDNSYLMGFGGKVFTIERWLIERVITYEAIGAGKDFALAVLYLGCSAKKAVRAAIELSVFCENPIQVIKK